jgi:sortase (surface protein transpeptidase)
MPYREVAIAKSHIGRRKKHQPLAKLLTQPYLLLIVIGLIGMSYFGFNLRKAPEIRLTSSNTAQVAKKPTRHLSRSVPTRIRIPAIDLDTSLAQVGLKADGSLQVPSDPYMAGWYTGSPTPGEAGPAVIDGHVDRVGGIAIFWRLRELKPGDVIEIDREDGITAKFKITSLEQFSQASFPTQKVYGNTGYAGIRLITCGGVFSTATGHYSDNIVVFGNLQ